MVAGLVSELLAGLQAGSGAGMFATAHLPGAPPRLRGRPAPRAARRPGGAGGLAVQGTGEEPQPPSSAALCANLRPEQAAGTRESWVTQYLISFGAHAMDHIPGQDMPAVAEAAHAVVQEAINAGVLVCTGGLEHQRASIVTTDGTVTGGPYPAAIGGLTVVEVPSREEALEWAARIAAACRCAQEVRAIGPDPGLDEMLRQADRRR